MASAHQKIINKANNYNHRRLRIDPQMELLNVCKEKPLHPTADDVRRNEKMILTADFPSWLWVF